jgi:uncharacterized protein YqjF (DUF2071 family)
MTALPQTPAAPVPALPRPVRMHQAWSSLTFLHWRFDPAAVAAVLPPGLEPDTYDGSAWAGLVLFRLTVYPTLAGRRLPAVPGLCDFPEVNVRTYVRGADGGRGITFLSLDAPNLGAVAVARSGAWALPYHWARIRMRESGDVRAYSCTRWGGASTTAAVRVGPRIEAGGLERFVTDRFTFYNTTRGGGLSRSDASHPPWELARAEVLHAADGLIAATGLPAPDGPPLALYSAGTRAAIGATRQLRG